MIFVSIGALFMFIFPRKDASFSDEREMSDHGEMDARFDIRFIKLKSNYNKMHYD